MEFLAYSGCRQGQEAASVRWHDVNFKLESVVDHGRGNRNEESRGPHRPIVPAPLRRFTQIHAGITRRKPPGPRIFNIRDARLQMQRACERIGLPALRSSHDAPFFLLECHRGGMRFQGHRGLAGSQRRRSPCREKPMATCGMNTARQWLGG